MKPNVLTDSGSTSACRFEKQTPQLQLLFSSRSLSMDLVKRSATMCSLMQRLVLLLQHRRLQLQVGPRLVPHEPKPQAQQRTRRRQRRSLRVLMCPLQQTKPPVIPSPVPTLIGLPPGLHHLHPHRAPLPAAEQAPAVYANVCSSSWPLLWVCRTQSAVLWHQVDVLRPVLCPGRQMIAVRGHVAAASLSWRHACLLTVGRRFVDSRLGAGCLRS